MKRYNPSEIEPKWQQVWADEDRYRADEASDKPKYYIASMFPYPSGAGMHAGHFFEHSIVDAVARFRRSLGHNVMYPMGWDSFGLPAENYAIKTGNAPHVTTAENIANFKNQLTRVGASIDWSREINTAEPEYYRWTQWVFTKLFERGLAYQKEANQWWCPKDKTVLANEQVVGGRCWRCEELVIKKPMKQWFFKITDYADELLEDIPALNWPDKIKTAQENWIGRSEGAEIEFVVATPDTSSLETASRPTSLEYTSGDDGAADVSREDVSLAPGVITVFTTRPDTVFGATFLVLAPEHPLVSQLVNDNTREAVDTYVQAAIKRSEIERMSEGKDKTGIFTGSYAINPATGARIPVWVADYVLWGYGTGAIMAVPAHDERDLAFAKKFELPVTQVVASYTEYDNHDKPREGREVLRRPVIDAIITDGNGRYLLEIEDTQHVHFVGGGIDDTDLTVEDAIRREILEETGYSTVISIRQASPFASVYAYRHTKDKNQHTWGAFYEVVIDPTIQVASEIDDGRHHVEWLAKDEVSARITWPHHLESWEAYLSGKIVDTDVREGVLVNSGVFDGMPTSEAREQIVAWLEQEGRGRARVTYKMRDWLISRQRYWGAPIPIVHCAEHGVVAVPETDLPVILPEIADFAPRGDGRSALGAQADWVNTTCPTCDGPATRETDTMDGYACSSWYLMRYTDPHNTEQAWDPALASYWTPLDMYIGGDHAVAHLLYVRFWHHVFYDMALVPTREPVGQLVYHGLIQAEDGRKMSKSLGNVVDPLEVIDAGYGADALRTFELFLGPINENSNWSSHGIAGVHRFLNRVWTLTQEYMEASASESVDTRVLTSLTHATIKKVTDDIHRLSFNTAIAALMEYVNELYKLKLDGFSSEWQFAIESLTKLVQPFAPHMAAELWQQLGHDTPLDFEPWPMWDESLIVRETMTIIVQVNGKLRAKLEVALDTPEDVIKSAALTDENVQKFLVSEPKKVIYIAGKLVSIVA
jgi:leucyl-tRNA synthetase